MKETDNIMLAGCLRQAEGEGFTELFQESENGDMGPDTRLYYRKPAGPVNRHGFPTEFAQIDFWGQGIWCITWHGRP